MFAQKQKYIKLQNVDYNSGIVSEVLVPTKSTLESQSIGCYYSCDDTSEAGQDLANISDLITAFYNETINDFVGKTSLYLYIKGNLKFPAKINVVDKNSQIRIKDLAVGKNKTLYLDFSDTTFPQNVILNYNLLAASVNTNENHRYSVIYIDNVDMPIYIRNVNLPDNFTIKNEIIDDTSIPVPTSSWLPNSYNNLYFVWVNPVAFSAASKNTTYNKEKVYIDNFNFKFYLDDNSTIYKDRMPSDFDNITIGHCRLKIIQATQANEITINNLNYESELNFTTWPWKTLTNHLVINNNCQAIDIQKTAYFTLQNSSIHSKDLLGNFVIYEGEYDLSNMYENLSNSERNFSFINNDLNFYNSAGFNSGEDFAIIDKCNVKIEDNNILSFSDHTNAYPTSIGVSNIFNIYRVISTSYISLVNANDIDSCFDRNVLADISIKNNTIDLATKYDSTQKLSRKAYLRFLNFSLNTYNNKTTATSTSPSNAFDMNTLNSHQKQAELTSFNIQSNKFYVANSAVFSAGSFFSMYLSPNNGNILDTQYITNLGYLNLKNNEIFTYSINSINYNTRENSFNALELQPCATSFSQLFNISQIENVFIEDCRFNIRIYPYAVSGVTGSAAPFSIFSASVKQKIKFINCKIFTIDQYASKFTSTNSYRLSFIDIFDYKTHNNAFIGKFYKNVTQVTSVKSDFYPVQANDLDCNIIFNNCNIEDSVGLFSSADSTNKSDGFLSIDFSSLNLTYTSPTATQKSICKTIDSARKNVIFEDCQITLNQNIYSANNEGDPTFISYFNSVLFLNTKIYFYVANTANSTAVYNTVSFLRNNENVMIDNCNILYFNASSTPNTNTTLYSNFILNYPNSYFVKQYKKMGLINDTTTSSVDSLEQIIQRIAINKSNIRHNCSSINDTNGYREFINIADQNITSVNYITGDHSIIDTPYYGHQNDIHISDCNYMAYFSPYYITTFTPPFKHPLFMSINNLFSKILIENCNFGTTPQIESILGKAINNSFQLLTDQTGINFISYLTQSKLYNITYNIAGPATNVRILLANNTFSSADIDTAFKVKQTYDATSEVASNIKTSLFKEVNNKYGITPETNVIDSSFYTELETNS